MRNEREIKYEDPLITLIVFFPALLYMIFYDFYDNYY